MRVGNLRTMDKVGINRWREEGKLWLSFPGISHQGFNYCSIGIRDKTNQCVMREGCGLQLISIRNALRNASFQAQIRVWEEARGQSRRLQFPHRTSDCTADDSRQGRSWFTHSSLEPTEPTKAISVCARRIPWHIFASDNLRNSL